MTFENPELTTTQDVEAPGTFTDVVELLVPELQRRGLYREEYPVPGGTLRENISANVGKPYLANDHYGSTFKWDAQKTEQAPETNGHPNGVNGDVHTG
jgi:hypothetical protein